MVHGETHPLDYITQTHTHTLPPLSIWTHSHHNTCPALFRLDSMTINHSSLFLSLLICFFCFSSEHHDIFGRYLSVYFPFVIFFSILSIHQVKNLLFGLKLNSACCLGSCDEIASPCKKLMDNLEIWFVTTRFCWYRGPRVVFVGQRFKNKLQFHVLLSKC